MEKTASLEAIFSCQMFSKSTDQQKIIQNVQQHPRFEELCTQLEQVQHMFQTISAQVPVYDVPEARKLSTQQRLKAVQTTALGNVIHVPFSQQLAPMYIVLRPVSSEAFQIIQLHLLSLMELCAQENRDCYVLVGGYEPIVLKEGSMSYDTFMQLMAVDEVTSMYPFEQLVKHSIAAPFVGNSDVFLVDANEKFMSYAQDDLTLLEDLKYVFQCSLKAVVTAQEQLQQIENLVDEVFVLSKQ